MSSEDLDEVLRRELERREAEQVIADARARRREPSRWPAVVAAVLLLAIAVMVALGVAQIAAGCAT